MSSDIITSGCSKSPDHVIISSKRTREVNIMGENRSFILHVTLKLLQFTIINLSG